MSANTANDILKQVLAMPVDERARLAHGILESLGPKSHRTREEIDEAWRVEIERRILAFERGETEAVDAREAIRAARTSLRR